MTISICPELLTCALAYCGCAEESLRIKIGWCAPVLFKDPHRDGISLRGQWCRKLPKRIVITLDGTLTQGCLHLAQCSFDFLPLRRIAPDLGPINRVHRSWTGTDHLKHPLGRIFIGATGPRAVAFEILGQDVGVAANVTEVDSTPAPREEEQTVEFLEQDGRGLMDGAEDGLAVIGELA